MKLISCAGANRYSVTGTVIFEDGSNTGVCPVCQVRVPLDLDGIVLPHEVPDEEERMPNVRDDDEETLEFADESEWMEEPDEEDPDEEE